MIEVTITMLTDPKLYAQSLRDTVQGLILTPLTPAESTRAALGLVPYCVRAHPSVPANFWSDVILHLSSPATLEDVLERVIGEVMALAKVDRLTAIRTVRNIAENKTTSL